MLSSSSSSAGSALNTGGGTSWRLPRPGSGGKPGDGNLKFHIRTKKPRQTGKPDADEIRSHVKWGAFLDGTRRPHKKTRRLVGTGRTHSRRDGPAVGLGTAGWERRRSRPRDGGIWAVALAVVIGHLGPGVARPFVDRVVGLELVGFLVTVLGLPTLLRLVCNRIAREWGAPAKTWCASE